MPKEKITLNTICPTIVATGISTGTFYQQAGERGLLVTVEALIEAFEYVIANDVSGEAIEVCYTDFIYLNYDPDISHFCMSTRF